MSDMTEAPQARAAKTGDRAEQNFDLLAGVSLRISVEVGSASLMLAELLSPLLNSRAGVSRDALCRVRHRLLQSLPQYLANRTQTRVKSRDGPNQQIVVDIWIDRKLFDLPQTSRAALRHSNVVVQTLIFDCSFLAIAAGFETMRGGI